LISITSLEISHSVRPLPRKAGDGRMLRAKERKIATIGKPKAGE
jgi:hypothetical protein